MVSPSVSAQEDAATSWPSADELRRDLQGIGYEFAFIADSMAHSPTWDPDQPQTWELTAPAIDDGMTAGEIRSDPFTLVVVDVQGKPAQLFFSATRTDELELDLAAVSTVLMEVASRLPDEAALDAAVWYLNNVWQDGLGAGATALPCLVEEFDSGATVVFRHADGELDSFAGSVLHFDGSSPEVEQCRELLGDS
jgi:hypothetical protein